MDLTNFELPLKKFPNRTDATIFIPNNIQCTSERVVERGPYDISLLSKKIGRLFQIL